MSEACHKPEKTASAIGKLSPSQRGSRTEAHESDNSNSFLETQYWSGLKWQYIANFYFFLLLLLLLLLYGLGMRLT